MRRSKAIRTNRGTTAAERRQVSPGGRPSLEESGKLGDRILDVATALFLAHGFGATSIEQVARRARISKRTLYHRYEDKAALFGAVLRRIVERLRPARGMPIVEGADLEANLRRLAELMLRSALTPEAIAVHRLIVGESGRFPRLVAVVNKNSAAEEGVAFIAGMLERAASAGRIAVRDSTFAARQFLYMVVTVPQRSASGLGPPLTESQLRDWPRDVVRLFLEGCR